MTGFAGRSEREFVGSIIRDDFGETAEKLATVLLRGEGLRLGEIIQRMLDHRVTGSVTKPSVHEVCSFHPAAMESSLKMLVYRSNPTCLSSYNTIFSSLYQHLLLSELPLHPTRY